MFKRILVPVDRTILADRVVSAALRTVDPEGEVILLRIAEQAASLDPDSCEFDLDAIEKIAEDLRARGVCLAGIDHQRPTVRAEVRVGPLAGTILEAAREFQVDCVVLGTHGRRGFQHVVGSVAERVASTCPASVFVIKATGFPFLQE